MADYDGTLHSPDLPNGKVAARLRVLQASAELNAKLSTGNWHLSFSLHGVRLDNSGGITLRHISYQNVQFSCGRKILNDPVLRSHPTTAPQVMRLRHNPWLHAVGRVLKVGAITTIILVLLTLFGLQSKWVTHRLASHVPDSILAGIDAQSLTFLAERDGLVEDEMIISELTTLLWGEDSNNRSPAVSNLAVQISMGNEPMALGLPGGEIVFSAGVLLGLKQLETLQGIADAIAARSKSQECVEHSLQPALLWFILTAIADGRLKNRENLMHELAAFYVTTCARRIPIGGGTEVHKDNAGGQLLSTFQQHLQEARQGGSSLEVESNGQ